MTILMGHMPVTNDPVQELIDIIHVGLVAHDAWEYVKDTAHATHRFRVYKNLGTENPFGADFYIGLGRYLSGQTAFNTFCAEEFDEQNDNIRHPCIYVHNASTWKPAPDGTRDGAGWEAPGDTFGIGGIRTSNWALPTTNDLSDTDPNQYVVDITEWGLTIAYRRGGTSNHFAYYMGLFESLIADEPFPLISANLRHTGTSHTNNTMNSNVHTNWSRHPKVPDMGGERGYWKVLPMLQNGWTFGTAQTTYAHWTHPFGVIGEALDPFHDKAVGARLSVLSLLGNEIARYGALRGLMPDRLLAFKSGTQVNMGDSITVDTDTWRCITDPVSDRTLWVKEEVEA